MADGLGAGIGGSAGTAVYFEVRTVVGRAVGGGSLAAEAAVVLAVRRATRACVGRRLDWACRRKGGVEVGVRVGQAANAAVARIVTGGVAAQAGAVFSVVLHVEAALRVPQRGSGPGPQRSGGSRG